MRLELTGQPGGFLAGILNLDQPHQNRLERIARQSGAQLDGLGLGRFAPRFCLRQLCPHLIELVGGCLGGLLLLGQRLPCLVGVLVCPIQFGA